VCQLLRSLEAHSHRRVTGYSGMVAHRLTHSRRLFRRNCAGRAASKRFMTDRYSIARAEPQHLDSLNQIELAAATLLKDHAPRAVLQETTPLTVLTEAMRRGHLWVALEGPTPVGFAHIEMLAPDLPHLEEIDVLPAHGRQGLGTRLVRTVCDWATASGYRQMTLTTFRAVAWNMPWYARLGFVELAPDTWPREVRRQVDSETARGLDPSRRVVMTYRCPSRDGGTREDPDGP
jgi:GNAT superfamily N-acetyltransferase